MTNTRSATVATTTPGPTARSVMMPSTFLTPFLFLHRKYGPGAENFLYDLSRHVLKGS